MKRQRGRGRKPGGGGGGGGGSNHGNHGNRSLESNGPEVKIRGTAAQIYEKYSQYARDAQSGGDRVKYESYLQHAEHYFRIMAATMPRDRLLAAQNGEGQPMMQGQGEGGQPQSQDGIVGGDGNNGNNNHQNSQHSQDAMKVVDDQGGDDGDDDRDDDGDDDRDDDVQASGSNNSANAGGGSDNAADSGGGEGDRQGRRRRRGRKRPDDRGPGPGPSSGPGSNPGSGGGGGGALDNLARRQGALAGD
jgi:hypothetical protein